MNSGLIDQYESGPSRLRQAIAGLGRSELTWKPPAEANIGLWSIQQVVIHLLDSDLIGIDRMKRIAAEVNPLLIGYNETLFANSLFYEDQSVEDACTILELARRMFAGVLRKLPEAAFEKTGIHNEIGKVVLGKQVEKYHEHFERHLDFIAKKRRKLGK
jgi:DinB superfamily